ncbi:MAG: hypothetical protein KIS86_13425 [Devosia sp.]|nr:hypothetical protein [Devosia sp.]
MKATSMWEFWSAWHGYVRANSPKDDTRIQDKDEMLDWLYRDDEPAGQLETQTYLWDGGFAPQGYVLVT